MIIPVGFAQINHIFTGPAMPRGAQVTYGVNPEGAADAAALAAAAHFYWVTHIIPLQPSTVTLNRTRAKMGPNETGAFAEAIDPTVGGRVTDPDAPSNAVLVTKQTALGGRSNRGRMFVPGVAEADTNAGGLLGEGEQGDWQDAFDAFFDAITGSANITELVLFHNVVEQVPTVITSLSVQQLLATQRRRLRKVGGRRRVIL